jgi:hypothetical protein
MYPGPFGWGNATFSVTRSDDGEHALSRHQNEVVISVGMTGVIAGMRVHLGEQDEAATPASKECVADLVGGDMDKPSTVVGPWHDHGHDDLVGPVLSTGPESDSLVSAVRTAEATQCGFRGDLDSFRDDEVTTGRERRKRSPAVHPPVQLRFVHLVNPGNAHASHPVLQCR